MNGEDVKRVLAVLRAAYPWQPITEETVRVYAEMLGDLDPRATVAAVKRHIATSDKFPTVAMIRRLCAQAAVGAPDAEAAWGEVMRAVSSVGRYRKPTWSHAAVESAVNALGWETICNTEVESLPTLRAHFYRTYASYQTRLVEDANVRPLLDAPSPAPIARLVSATAKKLTEGE